MFSKIMNETDLSEFYNEIPANAVIALDNHPVSYYILDCLAKQGTHVSVVTFSTDIMRYVCQNTFSNIIFAPGKVDSSLHVITGETMVETFKTLQVDVYFCSASYIDEQGRLYQVHSEIAALQKSLITQAQQCYIINYPDIIEPNQCHVHIGDVN
ncbi:sugar phosphate isomerase family [Staphylococcus simulans]